jgi:hypothetical protein
VALGISRPDQQRGQASAVVGRRLNIVWRRRGRRVVVPVGLVKPSPSPGIIQHVSEHGAKAAVGEGGAMTGNRIRTEYGVIYRSEQCRDDWRNIETYDQQGGHSLITLQKPAILSLKAAEQTLYRRLHPIDAERRKRRGKPPGVEPIIVLPGSKRTCELQASLYAKDPQRYAPPNAGVHTHGLAIDVSQAQRRRKLNLTYKVLAGHGWTRTRPDDEPWHWSFGVTA